jgi:hypothetical protein
MSIYGVAFEPYVGPWVGDGPVLYNTYTLDQVNQLLKPVAGHFSLIATYGQGTFVWQGVPKIQDGNRLNIQAAKAAGLKVSAGCFQQGADQYSDTINVEWTKTEIDYAIEQAKTYNNVVDLVIGNECIWGPNSAQAIIDLINYAKGKRAPLTAANLPVTTRQQWGVLGGVDNTDPGLRHHAAEAANADVGLRRPYLRQHVRLFRQEYRRPDRTESHAGFVHPGRDCQHDEPVVGTEEGILESGYRPRVSHWRDWLADTGLTKGSAGCLTGKRDLRPVVLRRDGQLGKLEWREDGRVLGL